MKLVKLVLIGAVIGLCGCAGLRRAGEAASTPSEELGGKTPIRVIVEGGAQIAAGNPVGGGISIADALSVLIGAAAGAASGHLSGGKKAAKVAEAVANATTPSTEAAKA